MKGRAEPDDRLCFGVRVCVAMLTIALILAKIKIIGVANNFITAFTIPAFIKQLLKVE